MLNEITPLSARFSKDIKNMVESHALERNKYQHKYPTLEEKTPKPSAPLLGIEELMYTWGNGHRFSPHSGRAPMPIAAALLEIISDNDSTAKTKTISLTDSNGKTVTLKAAAATENLPDFDEGSIQRFVYSSKQTDTAIRLVKKINRIK